jgi:hypothetical protein
MSSTTRQDRNTRCDSCGGDARSAELDDRGHCADCAFQSVAIDCDSAEAVLKLFGAQVYQALDYVTADDLRQVIEAVDAEPCRPKQTVPMHKLHERYGSLRPAARAA